MKKVLALVLAAVMVLSLAACGGNAAPAADTAAPAADSSATADAESTDTAAPAAEPTGEKITVILPAHEMDTIGLHEQRTRQFEEETGIEVELINMGWDDVADRITADLVAGGNSYDVIEFDNAWVLKFAQNDWLEPLDDYISDEQKNGMVPGLIDKFSNDGHLYGIVWNNDTRFFMYNKAKLDEAGISKVPETWDEVKEADQKLRDAGLCSATYIDSYWQGQSGGNELYWLVSSFGGKLIDENGKPVMGEDPKTAAAYQFLVDGMNSGLIDPSSLSADYETAANVFYMGDTAMMMQAWPGVYSAANDPETSSIVDEIAVGTSAPHAAGEEFMVLTLPEAMAIPKTSEHKEAAAKYIEYMSAHDFDKDRCAAIGSLPVWTDLYSDADLLALYPYWAQFAEQITHAKGLPDLLWYDEYCNILTVESQKILLGEVSVEEGLKEMQAQCEAVAKDYE